MNVPQTIVKNSLSEAARQKLIKLLAENKTDIQKWKLEQMSRSGGTP